VGSTPGKRPGEEKESPGSDTGTFLLEKKRSFGRPFVAGNVPAGNRARRGRIIPGSFYVFRKERPSFNALLTSLTTSTF
jgi:hypothetical protein